MNTISRLPDQSSRYEVDPQIKDITRYEEGLFRFIETQYLPHYWFHGTADHVAFKYANSTDFEAVMNTFAADNEATYIEIDGRRIGSVKLATPMVPQPQKAYSFTVGAIGYLEIMEPRPEKAGQDTVGLDHMEFCVPDLEQAAQVLAHLNIAAERQQNESHSWLSLQVPEIGELKLTSMGLETILAAEKDKSLLKPWEQQ